MRSSSQLKKFGSLIVVVGSLVAGVLSVAHADEGAPKGIGGFFRHIFTQSIPNNPQSLSSGIPSAPAVSSSTSAMTLAAPSSAASAPVAISDSSIASLPAADATEAQPQAVSPPSSNGFSSLSEGIFSHFVGSDSSASRTQSSSVANGCVALQEGDSRVVESQKMPDSMRALVANYMLSKSKDASSGDTVYTATINIKFKPKAGEDPSVVDTIIQRTNACYGVADIVSDQGEHLHLRLATSDQGIPATNVTVNSNPALRMVSEDAFDWSTHADCSTTLHESMHLLGLVDLYYEGQYKDQNGNLQWNCRATADDSLMDNLTFGTYASFVYEKNVCSCESSACARALDKIQSPPSQCPVEANSTKFQIGLSPLDIACDADAKANFETNYAPLLDGKRNGQWEYQFLVKAQPEKKVLYPAEFRAITQPGCSSSTLYYQCAKNAYLTSTDHGGSGCVTRPAVCDEHGQWLQ
jgi:hypothetical protein